NVYKGHQRQPPAQITTSYGIGQSRDGRIWVGGKPLWTYDGQKWSVFDSIPELTDYVDFIETSPTGDLWLASRYHGVFRYDGRAWRQFTTKDGLAGNNVISLSVTEQGEVWATTYGGFSYFDGRRWHGELFPASLTKTTEGGQLVRSRSGKLWFNHSTLAWRRRALKTDRQLAAAGYPDFSVVGYRGDDRGPITAINTNVDRTTATADLTFFWQGRDYFNVTAAEELTYSWRLDGGEWSPFLRTNYLRPGTLRSGAHTLEVRARDRDLNVDETPARHEFTVLPPWWRRWEFLLLAALALAALAFMQFRILKRNRKLSHLNGELQKTSALLRERNAQVGHQRDRLRERVREVRQLSQSQLRFFTNVSHEFRTPLSLILGPVEELINGVGRSNPEQGGRYHRIIQRNAKRILRLVNQILEVYKVEATTLDFSLVDGKLDEHCADILELFRPVAQQERIDLVFHCPTRPLACRFDPDKVEKIVFNLLSNAVKNVLPGGTVRLELARQDDQVRLAVEDTGRGIPPEELPRIFDRFYHTRNSRDGRLHPGMGIGLAYIKELVKTHRGTITVTSEPGVTTTFAVLLPYLASESLPAPASAPELSAGIHQAVSELRRNLRGEDKTPPPENEPQQRQPYKLLIVEDDPDTRSFLRDCFGEQYEVLEAADGAQGLELARQESPDAIVSDVSMPTMDGLAFCRQLKSDFDTSHIPVVLLTARTREEDKIAGFETGADAYVEKPFSWQLLRSRVSSLLQQRERLRTSFRAANIPDAADLDVPSVDEQFLKTVITAVEERIDDGELDAEQLAHRVGVSRIQLYRKLKALTGQTVNQFIRAIRLRKAATLLKTGQLTVAEVAYQTGFKAPNHFSTYFREHFGISPTKFCEAVGK
ncbi:MAG: ATP-binding protein, partial [Bacteroidota bacterium]